MTHPAREGSDYPLLRTRTRNSNDRIVDGRPAAFAFSLARHSILTNDRFRELEADPAMAKTGALLPLNGFWLPTALRSQPTLDFGAFCQC